MGRIKVLHIIGGGEFGGAEQHLLTLLNHLDKNIFDVHVVCLFTEPFASLVKKAGFTAHVFSMNNKLDIKPIWQMAELIRKENYNIVHTHGVRANLLGRLAAKKAGCAHIVTTVHSVLAFDYNKAIVRYINKICERLTRGITERFITVCKMLERHLVAEGIPGEKIVTIHNGIEIQNYTPELSGLHIRHEFGIDPDKIVIGVIARLHPVKGHKYLLKSVAELVKINQKVVLLLAGTGPCRKELEDIALNLGIKNNIIFAGFRKDIPEIISASDFLVLPSLSEGLSLTIVEGMAMKKAVIATAVGGTPEIITSGHDGLLVSPADESSLKEAIQRLIDNPDFADNLGIEARKTVESRFTAKIMADKTANLYIDILKEDI